VGIARIAGVAPQPLPPGTVEPPELAGKVVASAHATTHHLGGLPNPNGGGIGVTDATYQLTIDAPEQLPAAWHFRRFADVVIEAQRRAKAAHGVAQAVLQARDGTWYIAAVRFAHTVSGHVGFDLLDDAAVASIDLDRAKGAATLLAIVGTASGVNFSSQPWPTGLSLTR
jgi:hypothetical protein